MDYKRSPNGQSQPHLQVLDLYFRPRLWGDREVDYAVVEAPEDDCHRAKVEIDPPRGYLTHSLLVMRMDCPTLRLKDLSATAKWRLQRALQGYLADRWGLRLTRVIVPIEVLEPAPW